MYKKLMLTIGAMSLMAASPMQAALAKEFKIGIVAATTGATSFVGLPVANAVLLAIDEINKSGLLGGDTLKGEVQDTGSNKAQAITLFNRFALNSDALMIFGPTNSAESLSTAPLSKELKIVQYPVTIFADVAKASEYSFIGGMPSANLAHDLAEFGAKKLGVKKCAMVYGRDNDAYPAQAAGVRDVMKQNGVAIVAEDTITSSDSDFLGIATKIASQNIDCLLLITQPDQGANIVVQAKQAGLSDDVKILACQAMAAPAWTDIGGDAVKGSYVTTEYDPSGINEEAHEFTKKYAARYGVQPTNYSALAYDMMKLVANAIRNAGPDVTRQSFRDALAKEPPVKSIVGQGTYSLNADRIANFQSVILQVSDGKLKTIGK
ncbi:ABC transporter substrate-binding protein [Bosea sp. (in: a-proteobacteria)]|uniref:ABC transporter substrate-binding protein n=1 Tax=Bosea sp. (in: a-proteobacteria) TaxID=1871050 RepID=UPI002624F088|nr:ABC transporter substrate-binding protein [Bosea sp. (in: a-proteobacteria)]MCO5091223.1 ABC transporter substrate-binding protein [Bosea sp. (in: a-proteobacteria)]